MRSTSIKYLQLLFLIIILMSFLISGNTFALSRADETRRALDGTWEYYDPFDKLGTCTSVAADANLVGENNAEKIYNYFTSKGLSPVQAAGIMGNLKQESQYDPTANEEGTDGPNGSGGYGIAQWTGSRRVSLFKSLGNDVTSLAAQLQYLYNESKDRSAIYPPSVLGQNEWEGMKQMQTVEEAVIYWEKNFERAGKPVLGQRLAFANEALSRYGGSSGSSSGDVSNCTDNGSVTGSFSLPTKKIYYEQHPEWFSKPHHDYPSADIPVPSGENVYSISSGKVVKAPIKTDNTSYGRGVWIDAGNSVEIIYGHGLDGGEIPNAKVGDTVKPGQLIMHAGSTGNSSGSHIHLEIRVNGVSVCPQTLLVAIAEGKPIPDIKDLPKSGCTY